MDKKQKTDLRKAWRAEERAKSRATFPISAEALRALFDMLDRDLPTEGCDHTRRLTQAWLEARDHDVAATFRWLDEHSGFCACQILCNVEQHVADALADWKH